jgi:hypothetical protein
MYHRTQQEVKSTIEEDSEEECESDLYKQYSHLVYHEVDAIEDSAESSEHGNEIGVRAPQELMLEAQSDSAVGQSNGNFSKRRYLKSQHHKVKTGGRRRWRHLSVESRHLSTINKLDNKKHGYGNFYYSPQKVTYYNKYWDPKT